MRVAFTSVELLPLTGVGVPTIWVTRATVVPKLKATALLLLLAVTVPFKMTLVPVR